MIESWVTIAGLAAATAALKAAGPMLLGRRALPAHLDGAIGLLAPALLAALILTGTFADGSTLTADPRAAGLGCAGAAVALRAPPLIAVVAAAAGTATVRALA